MVVPDALRRLDIWGCKQVVVDNHTCIKEIALDIGRGVLTLHHVGTLILLVGRADVLNGDSFTWVLE